MAAEVTDTGEMIAVHDAFRIEFGALPGMVAAVPDGDVGRAAVIGGHVMMMTAMLHGHHGSEDVMLWPLLEERAPARSELVHAMEGQHHRIGELIDASQGQAVAWMGTASSTSGAELAGTMQALHDVMVEHLSIEEAEILPMVEEFFSNEEFARIGEHSRASLTQEQLAIGLGIITSDTTPELAEMILAHMPPEARAGFEQFGRPAYEAYRARLVAAG